MDCRQAQEKGYQRPIEWDRSFGRSCVEEELAWVEVAEVVTGAEAGMVATGSK